ncbi:hypothetical protein AAHC03_09485 [Spirometra sp. Aus1]
MEEVAFGSDIQIFLPASTTAQSGKRVVPRKRPLPSWLQKDAKPNLDEVCVSGETVLRNSDILAHRHLDTA